MFKEKFLKLKEIANKKTEKNNKKNIENLVVFLVLLIITVIAINFIWGKDESKNETNSSYKQLAENINEQVETDKNNVEKNIEEELEEILETIDGVGEVKVLVTYSETSEIVAMYNETQTTSSSQEEDAEGGKREVEEVATTKEVVYEENGGVSSPITQKVIMPKIEGAIITAEGGGNATTKTNITQAVSAVTGLSIYKIQVFEMKKN